MIRLVLMAVFYAAIRSDSCTLLRLSFLNHVHVLSCEMLLVSRLKYPSSYFSPHFCFLVISGLPILVSSNIFLVPLISHPLRFSMSSSSLCLDISTLSSILASPFPSSFLDTYSLSTSSLGWNTLCMVIHFLVSWSIWLSSSLVLLKIFYEEDSTGVILLIRLLLYILSRIAFWFSCDTLF